MEENSSLSANFVSITILADNGKQMKWLSLNRPKYISCAWASMIKVYRVCLVCSRP